MSHRKRFRNFLLAIASLCLATLSSIGAQDTSGFNYDGPVGLWGRYRTIGIGDEWKPLRVIEDTSIRSSGNPESPTLIDGLILRHASASIVYCVLVDGKWQAWTDQGKPAGILKRPIEGIKIFVGRGGVRYRVASLGSSFSRWVTDGDPAVALNHGPLNTVEVEWLSLAPRDASLEFRAVFKGHDATPWLHTGLKSDPLKSSAEESSDLIGLEVRNGQGIRYEVALDTRWQPTAIDGEMAGDPTGKHRVTSFRVFGGSSPVRYRVKTEERARWTPWFGDGTICPEPGPVHSIRAIQIEPDRGGP